MEKSANKKTIQERLVEIKEFVSTDLDSAKSILQSVVLDNKNDFYLMEIEYVTNMIREEELYQGLTSNQKMNYNCLKMLGRDFYESGDLERAYYHYEFAKEEIGHPIFDYYLGKMLYKQGKYLEALPYFQEYLSHGGKKLPDCLLYLIKIFTRQGQYKKANKLSSKVQKLEDTFGGELHYKKRSKRNPRHFYDHVKNVAASETQLNLEDLLEEDGLKVEFYNDYGFLQKLQVIKKLMIEDQLKRAESYLNNLTPETKEEQKALAQFQKNKRIYKNQRR